MQRISTHKTFQLANPNKLKCSISKSARCGDRWHLIAKPKLNRNQVASAQVAPSQCHIEIASKSQRWIRIEIASPSPPTHTTQHPTIPPRRVGGAQPRPATWWDPTPLRRVGAPLYFIKVASKSHHVESKLYRNQIMRHRIEIESKSHGMISHRMARIESSPAPSHQKDPLG